MANSRAVNLKAGTDTVLTLIKGARIFAPDPLGVGDILIAGHQIAAVAPEIDTPVGLSVRKVDGRDHIITPGFIDLHVHITGGGGEDGPASRIPEISCSEIVEAGVTTVVGLLGTDDISRTPAQLLSKALGLEQEGLNTFILSGSYAFPPVLTITGSVKKDLALIPHVIGVGELAISDHRSAEPTFEDFVKVAAEARVGGMLGHKAGLVNIHMGDGRKGFEPLFRLVQETDIPIGQLLPTHVNRNDDLFLQALEFLKLGGAVDLTIHNPGDDKDIENLAMKLDRVARNGKVQDRATFSSDANGSLPKFDSKGNFIGMGVGRIDVLRQCIRRLIFDYDLKPEAILPYVTRNPAQRIGIGHYSGFLGSSMVADLVLFDQEWQVREVYCRGRVTVENGKCISSYLINT